MAKVTDKDREYVVQVAIIREVRVTAFDDLQAERAAFAKLGRDKDNAVAMRVMEPGDDGGALKSDDDMRVNWRFAKEKFSAIDREWVNGPIF